MQPAGTQRGVARDVELAAEWRPPPCRWAERGRRDDHAAAALASALSLPATLCALLVARGHADPGDAKGWLRPRFEQLRDPSGLAGMDDAVARIMRALQRRETMLVHGDYDVDGVCSTALLTRTLRECGGDVVGFVPHRMRDGYDLGHAGVRAAVEAGAGLIVTADCGTVAHDAVAQAAAAGIDVIVTDHHTPAGTLPAAVAVVNPNRPDCDYGERVLAGAGVAYKLCEALLRALGRDDESLRYRLDLVALATIADLAPLRGENRVLVHYGLRVLRESRHAGVRALLRSAGVAADGDIAAGQVSHVLAPRLNALGRLGDAQRALRLLLTDSVGEAHALADESEDENRRRQALDRQTLGEVLEQLTTSADPATDVGLVLARDGWHPGVIGIVASRVVERVHRPVVLLAIDERTGFARGSGRSIAGVHLLEAVRACAPLLERFGGHRQAAGLEVATHRIDAFRAAFNAAVRAQLEADTLVPQLAIDLDTRLGALDGALLRRLAHLGPFGVGNPTPSFAVRAATVRGTPRVVGDAHLRVTLEQDDARVGAIGFRMAASHGALLRAGARVDAAVQLQPDRWRGGDAIELKLLDVRPCA
jgi:single-stranded-DNA-specific exonuclease